MVARCPADTEITLPSLLVHKYVLENKKKNGLFETSSFYAPGREFHDICISTMVGCMMGCKICGWGGLDDEGRVAYYSNAQIKRIDFVSGN